ncbi:hypothetical protein ABB37_09339 [Leptomonas pyrrhocoris]|uniref:Nudix hydrolase domain-containing protein n=1 Tax=Leptomonas pyrrhocoris TaxID=157538 RepID=A0A0M9FR43_LEPPY|nr:hypothetical protein ABB37_09339 [Leptomonas pyrrhocoris]KPA74360.1 hypothetical protein ABB37_09339 [Leptomonas pyrrhocoris]|eukprot:XP_015652799.1 hypothetical protein ABB37_09339 [Leptomonas pyrrhocoris]
MPPGLPGVDVKFLANVVGCLSERRLHAYCPGTRRSAAALVLRFDEATQHTLRAAVSSFRAASRRQTRKEGSHGDWSASSLASTTATNSGGNARLDPVEFLRYLQDHHRYVDPDAPSTLQLLFLKRADVEASRWSGRVAFPGGRRDPDDADDFQTVCRATHDELGLPLQYTEEFLCLGRLPDYALYSRVVRSAGVVQARFVFLHVGAMTPTVHIATHEVASVRWMPLHRLTAAHMEHGCVVHPLQSFLRPQDADYRLLLTEVFPNTYLTFPSVSLPRVEGEECGDVHAEDGRDDGASWSSRTWRVWGLTLRSANELLALDKRQPFDWPLVESNSRVLRYCVLHPFHGYYELLYQLYYGRAWLRARVRQCLPRSSVPATINGRDVMESDRRVLHGAAMELRYAVLPVAADALLFAAPDPPVLSHVLCVLVVAAAVTFAFYLVASALACLFATVGLAFGVEAALAREERSRAYYTVNVPGHRSTTVAGRSESVNNEGDATGLAEEDGREEGGMGGGTDAKICKTETQHGSIQRNLSAEDTASPFFMPLWQRESACPAQTNGRTPDEVALATELGEDEVPPRTPCDAAASPTSATTASAVDSHATSSDADGGTARQASGADRQGLHRDAASASEGGVEV